MLFKHPGSCTITILLLAALSMTGCSTTGFSLLNARAKLGAEHSEVLDLQYGKSSWQKLDVYIPDNSSLVGRPVLIFLYGGGWNKGQKEQYYFAASKFANLGYWVIIPDYVKYPEGKFPAFIEDGALAVAWVKENIGDYGGNPDKLFIVGHSAGAHLGALLLADSSYLNQVGLMPSDIQAFAGLAGPYNFTPKAEKYKRIFAPESNYPKIKIINYIDGTEPPMLLLHGNDDDIVNVANKNTTMQAIQAAGGVVQGIDYSGVTHVRIMLGITSPLLGKADPSSDIDSFFQGYLDHDATTGLLE